MAIVKMKRLRMAAMKQDREELLELLQRMGCVEIDEPSPDTDDPCWAELTRPDGEGLFAAREQHAAAEKALDVLKKYAPEKKGMLTPKPELAVEQLLSTEGREKAVEQAKRNMQKAAADLDFMAAAKYRDEMWALQQYLKVWK